MSLVQETETHIVVTQPLLLSLLWQKIFPEPFLVNAAERGSATYVSGIAKELLSASGASFGHLLLSFVRETKSFNIKNLTLPKSSIIKANCISFLKSRRDI